MCVKIKDFTSFIGHECRAGSLCREEPAFMFIAFLVQNVLMLLVAPNRLFSAEGIDLLTGLELVLSAEECVKKLYYYIHCYSYTIKTEMHNKEGHGTISGFRDYTTKIQ